MLLVLVLGRIVNQTKLQIDEHFTSAFESTFVYGEAKRYRVIQSRRHRLPRHFPHEDTYIKVLGVLGVGCFSLVNNL